jgi:molybdopterin converting factor small subunit
MRRVHIQYFAALRDAAGMSEETVQSAAGTAADLYREVARRRAIPFELSVLTVALNDHVVPWTTALHEGDTVVFLAPFAGG